MRHTFDSRGLKKPDLSKFWIIGVVSNPVRFSSRYRLANRFIETMKHLGANLMICEQQFGKRDFEIINQDGGVHAIDGMKTFGFRSYDELWHKEQMINRAVQNLPNDWEYIAWIDMDVEAVRFENINGTNWLQETWHQLQHHHVVQMFSHAIDLGPKNELLQTHNGFMMLHTQGKLSKLSFKDVYEMRKGKEFGHCGYAYACDKFAFTKGFLNGLVDFSILGAGDHHMARALIGEVEFSIPSTVTCPYLDKLLLWQQNAVDKIKLDVGFVPATIVHHYHGKKRDRGYVDRWKILVDNNFDPDLDLQKDWQGMYMLTDRNPKLRDEIRKYFRSRNEDSIDLE